MSHIQQPSDPGLFDYQQHVESLSTRHTCLDRLNQVVRWESFRPTLSRVFSSSRPEHGGRPRFDPLLMFKILVLQRTYSLSDEATELAVQERLTWHRFLGLHVGSVFPDAKTIWLFREQLKQAQAMETLFTTFHQMMAAQGVRLEPGKIVDATVVPVPVQHQTPEERQQVRSGQVPPSWGATPARLRQKDGDARWTKKYGRTFFGYKNHILMDARTKLIERCVVTPANVHESQVVQHLVGTTDGFWHGDSAYHSAAVTETLKAAGVANRCNQQGRRKHPLSAAQRRANRAKSSIRARVEHAFGAMRMQLHGVRQRGVGFLRHQLGVILTNLVYNMHRFAHLRSVG